MLRHATTAARYLSLLAVILAYALVLLGRVSAQGPDRSPGELTETLALARLCVNESGIRAYGHDDCAAIHAVVTFRAEHIYRSSYIEALHRYSHGVTLDAGRRRSRLWIADLWPASYEPWGWPARLPWVGRNARHWDRTYRHALDVFRGDIVAECYALTEGEDGGPEIVTPHTWANDTVRPADPGASVLDCGSTVNVFWAVPRYTERWGS